MKIRELPEQAYLLECFDYNFLTGSLTWRVRPSWHFNANRVRKCWNTRYANRLAGSPDGFGYLRTLIHGVGYRNHRIIIKMVTGIDPGERVDHRNENTSDNRLPNLRSATQQQNLCNRGKQKNNPTGFKGVSIHRKTGKFVARIQFHGIQKTIGYFSSPELAHAAYCAAAAKFHQEFAHA